MLTERFLVQGLTLHTVSNGQWSSHQLDSAHDTGFFTSIYPEQISLSLSCFKPSSLVNTLRSQVSLLPLGYSRILLSTITPSNPSDIQLLLWDLRYSVVLASASCPVPPSIAMVPPSKIEIRLSMMPSDQFALTLSPNNAEIHRSTRCVAMVASLSTIPPSTIAVAMRCMDETKKWISRPGDPDITDATEKGRRELMEGIRLNLKDGDTEAANKKFFDWVESKESKTDADYKEIRFAVIKSRGDGKSLPSRTRRDARAAILPYSFTAELLHTLFSVEGCTTHHQKILGYLLERRLVSQNMVFGGLTNSLVNLDDWVGVTSEHEAHLTAR